MTTKELVNKVLGVNVANLNTKRYGDVYDVLNNQSIKYTALVVELIRTQEMEDYRLVTLRLSVIDKLNEDETNTLDTFDTCEMTLHDILAKLPDSIDWNGEYTIDFIVQDFADKCAGCYAEIEFITEKYNCEYYG